MSEDPEKIDPIANSLGIVPMEITGPVKSIIDEAHNDSALKDFETARSSIHTMIDTAQEAIEKLSQIADSSQHPRAFEVLAKLIDTTVAANKSLLEMQHKIRELKNIESPMNTKAKTTINNSIFVGSTSELSKLLKQLKNGE